MPHLAEVRTHPLSPCPHVCGAGLRSKPEGGGRRQAAPSSPWLLKLPAALVLVLDHTSRSVLLTTGQGLWGLLKGAGARGAERRRSRVASRAGSQPGPPQHLTTSKGAPGRVPASPAATGRTRLGPSPQSQTAPNLDFKPEGGGGRWGGHEHHRLVRAGFVRRPPALH